MVPCGESVEDSSRPQPRRVSGVNPSQGGIAIEATLTETSLPARLANARLFVQRQREPSPFSTRHSKPWLLERRSARPSPRWRTANCGDREVDCRSSQL